MTTREIGATASDRDPQGMTYQRQVDSKLDAEAPQQRRKVRKGTKFAAILKALLQRGSLNCFQAALDHHDFVLRSTIASLRREYGFTFLKREETVPGHGGSSVHCIRYSLTAEDRQLARELLGEVAQ